MPNCSEIQKQTILEINNNYALNIFKNGLNENIKPTVFASRPEDLNQAVQLALELEKDFKNNEGQILYFSNNNHNNRKFWKQNQNNHYEPRKGKNYSNNRSNNYRIIIISITTIKITVVITIEIITIMVTIIQIGIVIITIIEIMYE